MKEAVERHRASLTELASKANFTVFLCGPALSKKTPSAILRQKIIDELEAENFDVILGEDDGLEDTRLQFGMNAQDNEMQFTKECNAIIVIADSPGSFCELGLFSWHYAHKDGIIRRSKLAPAFILLTDEQYKNDKNYLNAGPITAVESFGKAYYVNFETHDLKEMIKVLRERRSVTTQDLRGRPRGIK